MVKIKVSYKFNKRGLMDPKARLLPHLNLCFLQRKAYEIHRKKIDYIKSSLQNSRTTVVQAKEQIKQIKDINSENKSINSQQRYQMNSIKEEIRGHFQNRLSPWAKRKFQENQKQNHRMIKRLQKCTSTINRKDILVHSLHNQQIKERISKFKKNPTSNKTLLKCELSLDRLEKREKSRFLEARSHSRSVCESSNKIMHSQSMAQKNLKEDLHKLRVSEMTKRPNRNKDTVDRILLLRHSEKIKAHFQDSKIKARIQALRENNDNHIKPRRFSTEMKGVHWRTRCFTTEVEQQN